ncbi:hypothetical protein CDD83_11120 [Cordyceps sp. RAO-2017]|nr:hypothetical protein CDD83_11120 [Cordyceps sp. RAO-2017]
MGRLTTWLTATQSISTSFVYNKHPLLRVARVAIPLYFVLLILTQQGYILPYVPESLAPSVLTALTTPHAPETIVAGRIENGRNTKPLTPRLPRKIWQIFFKRPIGNPIEKEVLADAVTWLALNPEYQYVLLGDNKADEFARMESKKHPALPAIMAGLQNMGMKSDLLRYLVLSIEGGVYTDIDTEALKPIDKWIPQQYRADAAIVIGVEFDRSPGEPLYDFSRNISFSQWTIAAAPGHELFGFLLGKVVSKIEAMAKEQNQPFSHLSIRSEDVLQTTGPKIWTNSIFEYLQRYEPGLQDSDLSGLREPRLIGDVLIYPIDGVAMGVPHSGATNDGSIPDIALLKHKFLGSWKGQLEQ